MKRKLSILSMIADHSIGKVFLILLAVPVLNGIYFLDQVGNRYRPAYRILDNPTVFGFFVLSLVAMTFVLCAALRDRGGRQNYFLHRLEISPRSVFWNHTFYNALCYFLLFAMESMTLLGVAFWNSLLFPESFTHQGLMLECYMSSMIHIFFPLSDVLNWVVLLALVTGFGICTAAMSAMNRRGKRSITPLLMIGTATLYGHLQLESHALSLDGKVIAICCCVILSLTALWGSIRREVIEDA